MDDLILRAKILLSFWEIMKRGDFVLGEAVRKFEKQLAEFLRVKFALGVASGTDALILALKACGIGPGDEVIVPALGIFVTASAAAWVNAKPVFVDIEPRSFNIDPARIAPAITSKTKAIIAVHLAGRMADVEKIAAITRENNIFLIEDAAQAIGSRLNDHPMGYYSDIACLSFDPKKILSGYGDGGAILTNDAPLAERIRRMRLYGAPSFSEVGLPHSIVGTASRLGSLQAAVLSVKFEKLEDAVRQRHAKHSLYSALLQGVEGLTIPQTPPGDFTNGYEYPILAPKRDELHVFLRAQGVDVRFGYKVPLPYFEAFAYLNYKKGDFPVAEKIAEEVLVLPTGAHIRESEIHRIAGLARDFFGQR